MTASIGTKTMWFIDSDKFEKPTTAPSLSEEPLFIHRRSQGTGNRRLLIFVHGLGGDRYGTWDNFPKFIFEEEGDLHNVDIGMYAYVTGLRTLRSASIDLDREARVMADILRDARGYDGTILVGHSMGGLLIKAAIADLIERLDHTTLRRIAGMFLLATPQLGSLRVPGLLSWLGKDMRALRPHGKLVTKITETFARRVVGSKDSQMHGGDKFVIPVWAVVASEDFWVDELSAGITILDERRKDVRGLHTRIVKPQHRTEDAYSWVVPNIAECFKHYSAPQVRDPFQPPASIGKQIKTMGFKHACFISYAHGQNDLVTTFIGQLMSALKNYLEPYLDEEIYIDMERLKPGYEYNEALARAICESLCMVVVYSPMYEKRNYCLREFAGMEQIEQRRWKLLGSAGHGKRLIIPIIFRGNLKDAPQKIKDCIHYCDFSKFSLVAPDISRHSEFVPEIERICQVIKEHYDVIKEHYDSLQQAGKLDQEFHNCVSFQLPTEADFQPMRPAPGPVPQAFPGRTGG